MGKCTFYTQEIMTNSVKEGVDLMTEATIQYERLIQEALLGSRSGNLYYRGGKTHQASAAGEAPSNDEGGLRQSITRRVEVQDTQVVGTVASSNVYSIYLETGTSKMEARPMWRPKLMEMGEWFKKKLGGNTK